MNKVKATFYLSEDIADLIGHLALQSQIQKSVLVEQALRAYLTALTANASQLKRFHELVDKRLDANLSTDECTELQALEAAFDQADAATMTQAQQRWSAQDAEHRMQIEPLKKIGKKLDDLLHQFGDEMQSLENS